MIEEHAVFFNPYTAPIPQVPFFMMKNSCLVYTQVNFDRIVV